MSLAKLVYIPLIALLIFNQCNGPKKNNSTKTAATVQQQIKKPTLKEVKKRQAAVGTAITISRSQQKKLALKELIEKVSGQVSTWDKMLNSNTDIPKTKKAFTKLESELKSFSKKLNQL